MGQRRWLRGVTRDFLRITFRDWFGVQDNQAEVIVTLWERRGRPLTAKQLAADVNTHKTPSVGAIMERICVVRKAMREESIDRDDRGYFMTEVGVEECRIALNHMAQVLAREGVEIDVPPLAVEEIGPPADVLHGPETMAA